MLGEGNKVAVLLRPEIFNGIWKQENALWHEGIDGSLVVGDEYDRTLVGAKGAQDLLATGGIEVVRRFVEEQYIRPRHDEGGERKPCLLPSGEDPDGLLRVVSREQKRAKDSSDLRIGKIGSGVPHDGKHRSLGVEGLVLLGVVAESKTVAGFDCPRVGILDSCENLEECRLARPVETKNDDTRTPVDREVDVREHLDRTVGLAEPGRPEGCLPAMGRARESVGRRPCRPSSPPQVPRRAVPPFEACPGRRRP